jgi:hypothetical protein
MHFSQIHTVKQWLGKSKGRSVGTANVILSSEATASCSIAIASCSKLIQISEVNSAAGTAKHENAAGVGEPAEFDAVPGSTGGRDRLLALYDNQRFDSLGFGSEQDWCAGRVGFNETSFR